MIDAVRAPILAPKVVDLPLSAARAEKLVRQRAQDSEKVIIGDHARNRMTERDIDIGDVLQVLRSGTVDSDPTLTDRGEWQCKMVKKIRGARSVGVATIMLHKGKLFLKTVEWEDLR